MSTSYHIKCDNISGCWIHKNGTPENIHQDIRTSLLKVSKPVFIIDREGMPAVSCEGEAYIGKDIPSGTKQFPLHAYAPPLSPEDLGNDEFKKRHGLRYAYIAGAMANGISSAEMVETAGKMGMICFFGAAGLPLNEVEKAIDRLQQCMGSQPFGFNLIHSPNEPELEAAVVQLYLDKHIRLVSAAAYMMLTLPIVYYRVKGIHRDNNGNIVCPNKIIAKVSRVEVARKFFSPPPEKILSQLVDRRKITHKEAELAALVPMADDLTAEADSGGHTDNRSAISLLPVMLALRDDMVEKHNFQTPMCVGLGGGIATPQSTAAAFSMGADYVLTGSVNQACIEAGTSNTVRKMLAEADQADVVMAPAADMFEMGVKVQVLKRGTMFPIRAAKLYELYQTYNHYEDIPQKERINLETHFFKCSFNDEWEQTKKYFMDIDSAQVTRAENDAKHKMALVFRSYLGQSSNWAKQGDPSRQVDYQIWCGPAIGAFNEWTRGTFLERPENRETVAVAMNLLMGASYLTRVNWLKNQGVSLPPDLVKFTPMELKEIKQILGNKD